MDNTRHDGFWTPHGGKLLEVKVTHIGEPLYGHDTDFQALEYVIDYVYIKCEVLNLNDSQLRQGVPYKADINGIEKLIWFNSISRIDNIPIFNCENISDEEWVERNRINRFKELLDE